MPRLKWSRNAIRDMARLHDFLFSKSPEAARRAIKAIRQGVKILGTNPHAGRPIDELPAEFREWVIEFGHAAYVVLYRFDGKEVVILAIRHGHEADY